ncbi:putative repeat protein (TIGR01451 family) [Streptomyces sp. 846.5]|nr:DUF11 domain-containing protein [Streptomyces sp. 846.5]TDT94085.1 putative repeat protein (TIGR01451 family) [Streptomyces sp. 846.5]
MTQESCRTRRTLAALATIVIGSAAPLVAIATPAFAAPTGPVLSVMKTHDGDFTRGRTGIYTITVSNAAGASPTDATPVTVADTLPTGLTATGLDGGPSWTCSLGTLSCTRTDVLNPGQSYAPITLTVDVAPSAPDEVTNTATISGGGAPNASAYDNTRISSASRPGGPIIVNVYVDSRNTNALSGSVVATVKNRIEANGHHPRTHRGAHRVHHHGPQH